MLQLNFKLEKRKDSLNERLTSIQSVAGIILAPLPEL